MRLRTAEWLQLYVFTPGRRAWIARQVRPLAEAAGLTTLVQRCDAIIAHDDALVGELREWQVAKNNADGRETNASLVAADQRRDRTVGNLFRDLTGRTTADDAAIAEASKRIVASLFALGAEGITKLPFVEESAAIANLLTQTRSVFVADVAAAGVGHWVTQLASQQSAFDALYEAAGATNTKAFSLLKEQDQAGQEALAGLVVAALAATDAIPGADGRAARPDLRASLLAPVERQHEELRRLYRRGTGQIPDVDPATGVSEPEETSDTAVTPQPERELVPA